MSNGSRVRIGFLDHTAELGGAEIALLRLLAGLDRERADPVVVLFGPGPLVGRCRDMHIESHVVALPRSLTTVERHSLGLVTGALNAARSARYAVSLARRLRRLDLDVVVTNSLKADLIGGAAARIAGLPLVWYLHDRISGDYLPAPVAFLVRLLARHMPHQLLANSRATLETVMPLRPGRFAVVYPGLPESAFASEPRMRGADQVVGIVGRLGATKGQDIFLRAAAQVARTHPEARFVVIGAAMFNDAGYAAGLPGLVARLGLADKVEFTGHIADVASRVRELSVLVHASPVPEPFGQVVVEGMAAYVPVIGTRAGGMSEILEDGTKAYGRLVTPGDDRELAWAIRAVLDDPDAAATTTTRAYERARTMFTAGRTAAGVRAAVERAYAGQGRRRRPRASRSAARRPN